MIVSPNCKINLGLNIIRKRDDGFHDLETVFYPIAIKDVLEIVSNDNSDKVEFVSSGLPVAGDANDNLCVKAYQLLKKDFKQLPAIKMHLHKAIPMGAGLGGGSADAAFTLKLLNSKFQLGLSDQQLIEYALQLGSDCPFFILNKACFANGRGEKLQPIEINLSSYQFVMINPGVHINTGWAFSQIHPKQPMKLIAEIIRQPIESWKNELVNDFEKPVFELHPALQEIKEHLYAMNAIYASMSGSGSTIFGIFEKDEEVKLSLPQGTKHFIIK